MPMKADMNRASRRKAIPTNGVTRMDNRYLICGLHIYIIYHRGALLVSIVPSPPRYLQLCPHLSLARYI